MIVARAQSGQMQQSFLNHSIESRRGNNGKRAIFSFFLFHFKTQDFGPASVSRKGGLDIQKIAIFIENQGVVCVRS